MGLIQEINRRFLHPLGLALEILVDPDGRAIGLGGIQDHSDDPEGVIFPEDDLDPDKAARVDALIEERTFLRKTALGYVIQPIPTKETETSE